MSATSCAAVFWHPAPDPDAYAELFKRSSRVIKGVDPEAEVMTAGMFITPQSEGAINSIDFLRQVYDHRGMAEAIDVVGVHPYGPTAESSIEQVEKTRELVEEVGDDANLWVTEIGWGSDPDSGNDLGKTPEEQEREMEKRRTKTRADEIAPLAAFLCSDAAAGITGQIFGARGNEVYLYNQPRPIRTMHRDDGWTVDALAERLPNAWASALTPAERT